MPTRISRGTSPACRRESRATRASTAGSATGTSTRFGLLAVEWRESGELIGRVGPQYHRMWPHDPEVGWALDPAWWGRGLATEAGSAMVAWSFGELGFERVVSITTEANSASRNVMAKLGFTLHAQVPSEWGLLWVHALDR